MDILKQTLEKEIENELLHHNEWIDPYDAEVLDNRIIRGVSKRVALFVKSPFYKFKIFKRRRWDENYILLGIASLNLNNKENVSKCLHYLKVPEKTSWGLPVDWHTKDYIFPARTIMSTTTAECIHFLLKVHEKHPDLVQKDYLLKLANNLLNSLNKVYINDTEYLFSYTDQDDYQVYNSNLLVASALGCVGKLTKEEQLIAVSKSIVEVCDKYIPKEGYIPYYFQGDEDSSDAYHQLFSMRSITLLKEYKVINPDTLNRISVYFEKTMLNNGKIKLTRKKEIYDLQPYSEALRFYGIVNDYDIFSQLTENLSFYKNKKGFSQRIWVWNNKVVKSRTCYHRQGLLRLYCGLSYKYIE